MMLKRVVPITLILILSSCAATDKPAQPASAGGKTSGPVDSGFNPPKDAQFTIFCAAVTGPGHVERAKRAKETLSNLNSASDMKSWYLIIEEDQTLMYYGFYRTIEDPKAQRDRRRIAGMVDQMGDRPFPQPLFVELTAPDPAAPPEWNLLNAAGDYTLQIAVYKGSPQRKEAAVDSVREARKQGVEAYYYHGDNASLVCVGSWPASAVQFSDETPAAKNNNPDQPLIYAPNSSDPGLNQAFDDAARQTNAKLIRSSVKIVDPTLEATRRQFPYNSVNGSYMKHRVGGQDEFDHSLILRIPRGKAEQKSSTPRSTLAGQPQNGTPNYDPNYRPPIPSQTPSPPPPQPQPQQPQQPGSGRLRSIGD
jgi:hypothetical protein